MPVLALFKSIKFWAIAGALLALVSLGYFANRTYQKAIERAEQAETKQKAAEAKAAGLEKQVSLLLEQQRLINNALAHNDQNTKVITERTHTIEEKVRNVPETRECAKSPAIGTVLSDYSLRNQPGR